MKRITEISWAVISFSIAVMAACFAVEILWLFMASLPIGG